MLKSLEGFDSPSLLGVGHEMELPEDASMKPLGEYFILWRLS
jgi:hypothetical protein